MNRIYIHMISWNHFKVKILNKRLLQCHQGPLLLTLIPTWISNKIHHKVWDKITYPLLNFNGATVEV